jgi:outer membrane receptor protein involved in Fe transport
MNSLAEVDLATNKDHTNIEEITVTGQRIATTTHDLSISRLDQIKEKQPVHIAEILNFAPNTWISKGGSGQENLTAIRSPSYTGAGACGNFLMAEDNVPLRAPAFCNANQLFDANYQQAEHIEVLRGPGTAFHGASALHGSINIISPTARSTESTEVSLMQSSHSLSSAAVDHQSTERALQAFITKDKGYKDNSGYEQQKIRIKQFIQGEQSEQSYNLNVMNLDQQSAGYVSNSQCGDGKEAYKAADCKKYNPTPDAFRKAKALRFHNNIHVRPKENSELIFTPYLRANEMEFTMHYLPGSPTEQNGHNSFGLQAAYIRNSDDSLEISSGFDFDYSVGDLTQQQHTAVSPTIPEGTHYDYQVKVTTVAMFAEFDKAFLPSLNGQIGVRFEHARYDYENFLDDGSACAAGINNCRYYRPESDKENFFNTAANASLQYEYLSQQFTYLRASRGFRAPHTSDLYRLEAGQESADIDSEKLDAIEWGFNGNISYEFAYQMAAFYMEKDNVIIKTADRYRVDGQKTRHQGIELGLSYYPISQLGFIASSSYSKHQYDSNYQTFGSLNDGDIKGNIIDSAPRHIHSLQLLWSITDVSMLNLNAQYLGRYYLDADNQFQYPGHTLSNLQFQQQLGEKWRFDIGVNNLFDIDYADRADVTPVFQGGPAAQARYFIGEPRNIRLTISGRF